MSTVTLSSFAAVLVFLAGFAAGVSCALWFTIDAHLKRVSRTSTREGL